MVEAKKNLPLKIFFIVIGGLIPVVVVVVLSVCDMGAVFDSWGPNNPPDWRYIWLVFFKLSIYLIPPMVGVLGFYWENKDGVEKKKYWHYFIKALNIHFLILLTIKLLADSVLELDRIWGLSLLNSIKDVQTLIGYVVTLLLRQNVKIKPGVEAKTQQDDATNADD